MKSYQNLMLRGRVWHYEFERQGMRFRGSTGTHMVREAMAIVRAKIEEAEAGGTPVTERPRDGAVLTVTQLEAWDLERAQRETTHRRADRTIQSLWRRISRYFATIAEVNTDALAAYAGKMRLEGYSTSTIKRDLWAIHRAYAWAAPTLGLPPLGPVPKMTATPKGKARGRALKKGELEAFLKQLKGRALAHALIGLSTGIRREELERAQRSWLEDEENGLALVLPEECTKGRSERWAPLTPEVFKVCHQYLPLQADSTAAWRTAARKAGIEGVAMRDLRHTFASRMSSHDPDAARIICGHTSGDKNSAMWYQHLDAPRAAKVREILDKEFPTLAAHAARSLVR